MAKYDFSGWATRNDLRCADGKIIRKDAFKDQDGEQVTLVWNHKHDSPEYVLGHAILENREEGVYAYCSLNDTESGRTTKELLKHGDVASLSIWANGLTKRGSEITHGVIRELSVVLAGANPGAYIDTVLAHSADGGDEITDLYANYNENIIVHASDDMTPKSKKETKEEPKMAEKKFEDMTAQEALDSIMAKLSTNEQDFIYGLIGKIIADTEDSTKGEENMKQNAFDQSEEHVGSDYLGDTISHSEMANIISDARRMGSMKEAFIAHGIEQIDYLYPDYKSTTDTPEFLKRGTEWVQEVMNGVHKTPYSRIKSLFADLREDDARALGYIKGNLKKEEVFSLLKRTTSSTTIYKKQKLDRDDIADITDFDVVAWIKAEMRMMLDEEIARAVLIGDGRLNSSDDKIKEDCIRPISKDDDLYTIKATVDVGTSATPTEKAKEFIKTAIRARKDYKGSGNPTLYTTEEFLTECLLIEDSTGRTIYPDETTLARHLRVSKIVTVPVMNNTKGKDDKPLMGIIVNLVDYNIGADKGGAVNMFDDFDIDYNKQKYLIETRCSGALIKPFSAIAVTLNQA